MTEIKKAIPIGVENFAEIIEKDYYYVDKTLMIRDLLTLKGKVNLFTRPRRFGKTLNLSMIRYFFEDTLDEPTNEAHRRLFTGLKIMQTGEEILQQQCAFPVISLTLKSAKQGKFEVAYGCLAEAIAREYRRHNYVLDILAEDQREKFLRIRGEKASDKEMGTALAFLSECLYAYHKKNVIILIDEYDVPLENSFFRGFYQEMVDFIRSMFESALKTNEYLEFAVVTGCLRISKESIFTGMNHLIIHSVLGGRYAEYFGFEPTEVEAMVEYYGISEKMETLKQWYDGYLFGNMEVYNPWSVINYVSGVLYDKRKFPVPYWSNTSSNDIVRHLVERADRVVKDEIELLIAGGTIEKPVHEDITYEEIYKTQNNLWNFLFFTGYLKKISERIEGETIYLTMKIPNREVRYVYCNSVLDWFHERLEKQDFHDLYACMESGDAKGMQKVIDGQLKDSISFMDSAENFYHGFLAGLLGQSHTYVVKSNRESGNGRGDLFVYPPDLEETAFVLELKASRTFREAAEDARKAVRQIVERDYARELYDMGFDHIKMYGVAFFRKNCKVYYGGKAYETSCMEPADVVAANAAADEDSLDANGGNGYAAVTEKQLLS